MARKPEKVWVVEVKGRKHWYPTAAAAWYGGAKRDLELYRENNPDDKFRIARYYAKPEAKR